MIYNKPIFRVDKRPIVKIDCSKIPFSNIQNLNNLICPDLDGDGIVGASDLASILSSWGMSASEYDLDGDGIIGASDLAILLSSWGESLDCSSWPSSPNDRVCNLIRKTRGISYLCQPNGFSLFFSLDMEKLYQAGFRRFILQCPSGVLNNGLISSNIKNAFDNLQTYSIKTSSTNEIFNCEESSLPFDSSNLLNGSFANAFSNTLKAWVNSKKENVDIYIESSSKVLYSNNGSVDYDNIQIRADSEGSYYQNFDPDNSDHLDWLISNYEFLSDGIFGISLYGNSNDVLGSFDKFKNINECIWKTVEKEFIAFNVENIDLNTSFSNYSRCRIGFDSNFDTSVFDGAKLFQYNTEMHYFNESNIGRSESELYEICYSKGLIPSLKFTYGSDINLSEVSNSFALINNAIESAYKQVIKEKYGTKAKIFSEHAGNASNKSGSVSTINNYLRSDLASIDDSIIPVVKVNCSTNFDNLELDIARSYAPAWWFSNNSNLLIDPSMSDFVSDSWTIANSDDILKVNSPSPYGTTGPEKCADSAFDQILYYQSFYNGQSAAAINFKENSNYVIKLENWGDLFDHDCTRPESIDAIAQGWCRLFTHYEDSVSSYTELESQNEIHPISSLKNLFAKNGTAECSVWVKRFLKRIKWRQANLASYDHDYIVPDPSLIYIDGQVTIKVSDLINYISIGANEDQCLMSGEYYGSWTNHIKDPRYSRDDLGFKWRQASSLNQAFDHADLLYNKEFSVIRTDSSSDQTYGNIYITDFILTKDKAYTRQSNAAIEKWLAILIEEIVARRVYESLGVQVENAFSCGRYAQKNFSGSLPESIANANNIHAPFYSFINRWQHYNGKFGFDQAKTSSFYVSYINPSSIIIKNNITLPWNQVSSDFLRFEVLDYYNPAVNSAYIQEQWGWPIKFGDDPDGRGIFVYGNKQDAFPNGYEAGDEHRYLWRESLSLNHVRYVNHLVDSIILLDSNEAFFNKTKIVFTPGVSNSIYNPMYAPGENGIGDLSVGKQESGLQESYMILKEDFVKSWYKYLQYISSSSGANHFIIHQHKKMSVFDWNELSNAIDLALTYQPSEESSSSSSSSSYSSSSSSSVVLSSLTEVIKVRIEPEEMSEQDLANITGWNIYIREEDGNKILFINLIHNSYSVNWTQFNIQGKFLGDLASEINLVNGLYAAISNNSDLSNADGLIVGSNANLSISEYGKLYLDDPIVNFTGFENPFSIISVEGTVNDYSLIGNLSKKNYGRYPSMTPILPSAILDSVIGGSSSYFAVSDDSGTMQMFNKVSINGEIIKIKSWSGNRAEIEERASEGTVKKFHVKNSNVFGISNDDLFDDNFYIDNESGMLYQYRCISIRNKAENLSLRDFIINIDKGYNLYVSKMSFAYEMPVNKYIKLSPFVGSGTSSISISTENITSKVMDSDLQNLVGNAMRFTDYSGNITYRSILSLDLNFISLDIPLPKPANQYRSCEILPGPASNSYQGKISPVLSKRLSRFYGIHEISSLEIPELSYNTSRVIDFNDIIYIWVKQEVPKNSRMFFETSIPIKLKFKIQ
jgi:hypothetical protein